MAEKEYIERKAVIELITRRYENPEICTAEINAIPAADVVPVKRGPTEDALSMIRAERQRQTDLWGDQSGNHPFEWMSILGEEYGELCEAVNETCFKNGVHPERGGIEKIIKEAVQVAAVATAIIEAARGAKMDGGKNNG